MDHTTQIRKLPVNRGNGCCVDKKVQIQLDLNFYIVHPTLSPQLYFELYEYVNCSARGSYFSLGHLFCFNVWVCGNYSNQP